MSPGGDAGVGQIASVVEVSAEEFARLKNKSKVKTEVSQEGEPATKAPKSTSNGEKSTKKVRRQFSKPGRHICPFCGRGCAKPSVLQKHLRAHTGERPFPCTLCGFAFKTKSNLYKHCKSRAHALKAIAEGKMSATATPIKLQDGESEGEITDDADESIGTSIVVSHEFVIC